MFDFSGAFRILYSENTVLLAILQIFNGFDMDRNSGQPGVARFIF